jgi:hypothetical protein
MIEATVLALVETIVGEYCAGADRAPAPAYEAVARYLLETKTRMPDHLHLPFAMLTLLFGLWAVPTAGRPFHLAPDQQRRRQLRSWRTSRLGFRRDLIRYYETLTLFGWYADHHGEDHRDHHGEDHRYGDAA